MADKTFVISVRGKDAASPGRRREEEREGGRDRRGFVQQAPVVNRFESTADTRCYTSACGTIYTAVLPIPRRGAKKEREREREHTFTRSAINFRAVDDIVDYRFISARMAAASIFSPTAESRRFQCSTIARNAKVHARRIHGKWQSSLIGGVRHAFQRAFQLFNGPPKSFG